MIDVQGYTFQKSFIAKEMTIVALDGGCGGQDVLMHIMASPPFGRELFLSNELKSVFWLEHHHHKIQWEDGDVNYSDLFADLRRVVHDAEALYVKGSEKSKFIRDVTGKFTIDLDELDCPRADLLPEPDLEESDSPKLCSYYNHRGVKHPKSSLVQALKYKQWILGLFPKPAADHDEDELSSSMSKLKI